MREIILIIVLVMAGCRGVEGPAEDQYIANCITSETLHDECTGDGEQDYESYCMEVLAEERDRFPNCIAEWAAVYACDAEQPCGWLTRTVDCAAEVADRRDCRESY